MIETSGIGHRRLAKVLPFKLDPPADDQLGVDPQKNKQHRGAIRAIFATDEWDMVLLKESDNFRPLSGYNNGVENVQARFGRLRVSLPNQPFVLLEIEQKSHMDPNRFDPEKAPEPEFDFSMYIKEEGGHELFKAMPKPVQDSARPKILEQISKELALASEEHTMMLSIGMPDEAAAAKAQVERLSEL